MRWLGSEINLAWQRMGHFQSWLVMESVGGDMGWLPSAISLLEGLSEGIVAGKYLSLQIQSNFVDALILHDDYTEEIAVPLS